MYLTDEKLDQIYEILLIILKKLDPKANKPFMNITEAAEYLGIPKGTLYSYTSKNVIPYYKVQNKRVHFKVEDLDNFILNKNNRLMSNEEIEREAMKRMVRKKI